MSASYSMFKTHCGASGVERSTTGNFTSPTDINLIVAKNNIIEIYKLPNETANNESTKLLLIARYNLFGEVQDIKTARFVPNHCDSLLLTFPDAKLSVIDFDASQCNIITRALFNFDPLYRRIGNITSSHDLNIRVDPLQRCAAVQISQDLLFVLPLFVAYLNKHKKRKGSHPINIIYHDTLANEHQQEIEDEEQRLNPNQNRNHNHNQNHNHNHNRNYNAHTQRNGGHGHGHGMHRRRDHRNNKYISPLPPPLPPPNAAANGHGINTDLTMDDMNQENEEEDIDYIKGMVADNIEFDDDSEWDIAYQKQTYYHYKSLCARHYFIINLRAKCQKIVDFIFLDGYNTPQILMLFEKTGTWGGRVPVRNKTISLLSLTVNVVRKQYNIPFILLDILSYDFNTLYPIVSNSNMLHSSIILQQSHNNKSKYIQTNIGGAFLIGSNAILHFGQNIDFGLSFNRHGDILSKDFVLLRKWTERVINFEHCTITALDNNGNSDFLLSDGDGFMYLLSIQNGKMNLCTFGMGPIPTNMIHIQNNNRKFVFIGSRLGDSLLLCHKIREKNIKPITDETNESNDEKEEEMCPLKDKLFGDGDGDGDIEMDANNNQNNNMDENKNRKRTFSEMDTENNDNDKNENENENEDNNDDLAMDLFGVTTETLAAAAENSVDPQTINIEAIALKSRSSTPIPLRHHSLYGPKIKRRKLSNKTELQIHDLHFMNVVDFEEDKLFELEIRKENRSRPISNFEDENNANEQKQQNDFETDAQMKEYRKNEQILREKYEFKIHDKMTNLSPITSVVMSKSHDPRFLHSDYINLMASTGFGTQAKLSIVQEGIRPQILAKTNSDKIISAINCWTLFKPNNNNNNNQNHSYLIATNLHATQVIDVSDKITPIITKQNDFKCDVRSIICGHVGGEQMLTVQIYEDGVRLLNELTLINEMSIHNISDAYICDPYILLHFKDKSIQLLTYDMQNKTFDVNIPNENKLRRYKDISDVEKERRKKEFVLRRCNKMTWEQYMKLEVCINDFINNDDINNDDMNNETEKDINGLIEYIDETLINPPQPENDENEEKHLKEKCEKKTNSMKEEASDSDGDIQIELSDDIKKQMHQSTGWQNNDWTKPKKLTKTLFNLNLNIDVILKRLYGQQLFGENKKTPSDILLDMITRDLDCGEIVKVYLYKFNGIKTQTLSQLNTNWKHKLKALNQENASTFQQLLSSSFQTKRLDINALKMRKRNENKNKNNIIDNEQTLLTGLFFGNENENENGTIKDKQEEEEEKKEETQQTFAVIARTSGTLQIFLMASFALVFECSEIQIGHNLLCNNLIHDESLQIILSKHQLTKRKNLKDFIAIEKQNKLSEGETYFDDELIPQPLKDELWCSSNDNEQQYEFESRVVQELYVSTFNKNYPYLLIILSNGDLLIYQMFEYFVGANKLKSVIGNNLCNREINQMQILPLRLNRFKHKLFTRKKDDEIQNVYKKQMYPITNMNGLSGVLVSISGNTPVIVLSHRGCPVIHNLSVRENICGFAIFNHDKIHKVAQDKAVQNGCIYFTQYGLVIATIPKSMHNIACNANVFGDIDDDDIENENEEKKNEIAIDIEEEEEKTQKTDKEKEEEEELEEEEEMNNMEMFGHSFVLRKQRISNNFLPYISIDYNFEYPVCHIPLSETLHFIVSHPQSGTYLLIMSRSKYIAGSEMLRMRDIRPAETYFECRLLNPYKWRYDDRLSGFIIHQSNNEIGGGGDGNGNGNDENDENSIPISEHILCVKSVCIEESSRIGSQTVVEKNMIVLGTGTNQGEDSASIGRIVMLEIIPEKDNEKLNEIEKDERFYIQSKTISDTNLLSGEICELSLENEQLTQLYEEKFTEMDKKYYEKELSYYKKCMQQDKINNIRYRIHYVFARRERAAVTALNCVNGLIVAAIGPKLLLFRWDGTQLIGCAFLDTRIHCHNILVLKNFVATADLFQGLDLYHWEQDIASIVKLARDVQYRSIYSVHWRIHNRENQNQNYQQENQFVVKEFEFLVSDMNQNLHLISFEPHLFGRFGFLHSKMDKEKLYTKCLFHIGTNICDSILLKFRDASNYFNVNVCSDGSISYLIPICEQIYRRLSSLHSQMIFYCAHNCGLNPREYRYGMNNQMMNRDNSGRKSHIMYNHSQLNAIHACDRSQTATSKNIIDLDLIKEFQNADYRTQNKLTTNIGVKNSNVIFHHLKQLYNNTTWF